jgi:MFS family permease
VTPRAAVRLAWGLWGLAVALIAAALAVNAALVVRSWSGGLALLSLAFLTVGAFLAGRRPGNAVGWLLLGWGMVMAFGSFTGAYVNRALVRDPGSLPGPEWAAWAEAVVWHPAFVLLVFLLLLFPHGRLPSRRWRPFAWFTVAVYLTLSLSAAFSPGAVELYYPEVTPPVRLPVAETADTVFGLLLLGQLFLLATALVSVVLRLRRASGEERQQVKWFVYTVVTVILVFVVSTLMIGAGVLFPLFGLIPVSVAVAVFKYRLYEIDRLINRTLVYGLLTALLVGVYAGLVFLLGRLLDPATGDSALAVAASTLAVAALFQPARRRVQALVDRRFNRGRYDAARTVERFSGRLRDHIDLDTLSAELLSVVDQTVQPTRASIWLRSSGGAGGSV